MKDIEILFKEYEALRAEILKGISSRNTILSIGITVFGIICTLSLAFVCTIKDFSSLIFMFIIPAVMTSVLYIWFCEYKRVQNAGIRLYRLEKKINDIVGQKLLSFETNTRDERQAQGRFFDSTLMLLSLLVLLSMAIGLVLGTEYSIFKLLGLIFFVAILIIVYFINRTIGKLRKIR